MGAGWKLIHYSNALSGENELSAEMSSAKRFSKDRCLVFIFKINTLRYTHLTRVFFIFSITSPPKRFLSQFTLLTIALRFAFSSLTLPRSPLSHFHSTIINY